MKISKSILLVTLALGATGLLQAQEMTAKTSAKTESTIPPPGSKPTLAADSKPGSKEEAKKLPASTETKVEEKEVKPEPKLVSGKDKPTATSSPSTMAVDIPNTTKPAPLMPATSSTTNATAPVTREPKKTTPAAGQQKQQN